MITKVFWTVLALDGIAAFVLWKLFESGPHGQGEGLVVLAYLVFVAVSLGYSPRFSSAPVGWVGGPPRLSLLASFGRLLCCTRAVAASVSQCRGKIGSSAAALTFKDRHCNWPRR